MVDKLLDVFLALISSGTLGMIIKMIRDDRKYKKAQEEIQEERHRVEAEALQAILKDNLDAKFEAAVLKGGATLEERNDFGYIYERYHALGQNGIMDEKKAEYYELPILM